jgi:hypothetical protein
MISGSYLLGFYSFKAVSPTDGLYADRDKFLDPFIGIYVYILYSLNNLLMKIKSLQFATKNL